MSINTQIENPIELRNELAEKEGSPYHETAEARVMAFKNGWDEGFQFRDWLNRTNVGQSQVPIHIKYRMFKNQEARKILKEIKANQNKNEYTDRSVGKDKG